MHRPTAPTRILPTPRPAPSLATGLLYVHLGDEAASWCLVTHGAHGATTHTGQTPTQADQNDDRNINTAALAGLEEALKIATPENHLSLYVYNVGVRTCIAALGNALPNIRLASTMHDGDLEIAQELTHPKPKPEEDRPAAPREPIRISTDASKRTRGRDIGLGWVIDMGQESDPEIGSYSGEAPDILCGELMAIEMAARAAIAKNTGRPVHVESDSRVAISAINRGPCIDPSKMTATQRSILSRILTTIEGHPFTFSWVKGHADNAMNVIADRVAVAVRRNAEMGIPQEARATIMENIRRSAAEDLRSCPQGSLCKTGMPSAA